MGREEARLLRRLVRCSHSMDRMYKRTAHQLSNTYSPHHRLLGRAIKAAMGLALAKERLSLLLSILRLIRGEE